MDSLIGFVLFGLMSSISNYIPWTAIFLLTRHIGIHLYVLKVKEDCQRIQKNMLYCSHIMDNGKSYGYSVGRWYVACISITTGISEEYSIWIIATKSSFDRLIGTELLSNTDMHTSDKVSDNFTILSRSGSFFSVYYRKRSLSMDIVPMGEQKAIMDDIIQAYTLKKHLVVLLHGPVGTGKSMLAMLIAKELEGYFCNTAKFWEPGDSLDGLYFEADTETPLIVTFDEVDTIIHMVDVGIERHKSLSIQLQGRTQWNQFMDNIQMGMYPNLILILTTNKTPEEISSRYDASYLRKGRVDMIREMKIPL